MHGETMKLTLTNLQVI